MTFKVLQRILKGKDEVIICTFDGVERRIFTKSIRFDLDMKHVYLKKLKLNIRDISRIKKIENKKDGWITRTLEEKQAKGDSTFIIGEDFQISGLVYHLDKETVILKCVSFDMPVIIKLNKITSIY